MPRNLSAKTLDVKAYYIIKRGRNVALSSNTRAKSRRNVGESQFKNVILMRTPYCVYIILALYNYTAKTR